MDKLTNQETEDLKQFIFRNYHCKETMLKVLCTCPECGCRFFLWLSGGWDMDIPTIDMHQQTTDCGFCSEDDSEESEEYEESFPTVDSI